MIPLLSKAPPKFVPLDQIMPRDVINNEQPTPAQISKHRFPILKASAKVIKGTKWESKGHFRMHVHSCSEKYVGIEARCDKRHAIP